MTLVMLTLILALPPQAPDHAQVPAGISKAADQRHDALAKELPDDAKKKLTQAAHDLLIELAPTPAGTDAARHARGIVQRLFTGLTPGQLDVLTFYTLVGAGQKTSDVAILDKFVGGGTKDLTSAESHRLHHLVEDRPGYVVPLDKLLKKISPVPDSVVRTVK